MAAVGISLANRGSRSTADGRHCAGRGRGYGRGEKGIISSLRLIPHISRQPRPDRKGLYAGFHYLDLQGQIDQLEDRDIRNVEAAGSNPALSTFI